MVKQMALVKLNWQQNKTESHELEKGTGKEEDGFDSDEMDIGGEQIIIRIHWIDENVK